MRFGRGMYGIFAGIPIPPATPGPQSSPPLIRYRAKAALERRQAGRLTTTPDRRHEAFVGVGLRRGATR